MECEIVAVGTELLLGQIVNSNAAWMGEQLALRGIDHRRQTVVGDNQDRIVAVLREALHRADAVIVCGGLGPTQDDITREAIAEVMGVELRRDDSLVGAMEEVFARRGREMPGSNLRQADVPVGATPIEQRLGTAPGLICPVGDGVVYAVPGVPHEMREMLERAVLPDLEARAGERRVIVSRVLRVWGESESRLAELLAPRHEALEGSGGVTLAFLASGIEGIRVRLTAAGASAPDAEGVLEDEETRVRAVLGDKVFSGADESMEAVVGALVEARGRSLAVAESLTGGLLASRLVAVPGASAWFRGGIVAYDSEVKFDLLDVPEGPVVCEAAAKAMAEGARRRLGADIGLATTGVAGPVEQEDQPVGTVWLGMAIDDQVDAVRINLSGDRDRIRQLAVTSVLDRLRRRLLHGEDPVRSDR